MMTETENTFERAINALSTRLGEFISYCEATRPEDWYLHKVRNHSNTKNCLYGHLINWYYGKGYTGNVQPMWDAFEEVGSTFYVYPINDGTNPNYPQPTARERCIQYLKNVLSGEELWTAAAIERDFAKIRAKVAP